MQLNIALLQGPFSAIPEFLYVLCLSSIILQKTFILNSIGATVVPNCAAIFLLSLKQDQVKHLYHGNVAR